MDPPYYTSSTDDYSTRLPNEILLDIFKSTLLLPENDFWIRDVESKSSFFIAQTCRRWRALSLSSSRLWSQIYIHWPRFLAFLYLQRAGPTVQLSFMVNEEALEYVADVLDTDRRYQSDDDSDYKPESDESSDYSDVDSVSSVTEEEVLELGQTANSNSLLTDIRALSTDRGVYGDPYAIGSNGEFDEDESTATAALLLSGLRNSGAAILFAPGIRPRIQSVHFDSQRFSSDLHDKLIFTEEILEDVRDLFSEDDFPSLQAWGTKAEFSAIEVWHPLSKERLPRLRQLEIASVHFGTPLFKVAAPLVSLDLRYVVFHGLNGGLAAHMHVLLSTLPSLEDLTLIRIEMSSSPSSHASSDDVSLVELPLLKTLMIALEYPYMAPFLKGLKLPVITEVICWPLYLYRLVEKGTMDSDGAIMQSVTSIFSTLKGLLSPSSHLNILSVNSLLYQLGCDFVLAPSSGSTSITFRVDNLDVSVIPGSQLAFTAQFMSLVSASFAIRRLVLRPFSFLKDSGYGDAWLLPLIKPLQVVEAIELCEFPDCVAQLALLETEEHTLAKVSIRG